jgi:wobble nucleotide-excising tRNase
MIEKIINLKGIGLLHDSLENGALTLSKAVVIYSDNGQGKSTLACLLRSLPDDDCDEVCARQTLGERVRPHAELLVGGAKHTLSQGSWDRTHEDVHVFDDDFVEKNVCSGMRIEPKHRESLLEFALGKEGTSLKTEIDGLAGHIAEQNDVIRVSKAALVPQAAPYILDEFAALPEELPSEAEVAEASRAVRDAENAAAIAARPLLSPVDAPSLDAGKLGEYLSRCLEDVSSEAEELVHQHLRTHLGDDGERWLREGAVSMAGEDCPFCGQPVDGVALVQAYRAFFSDRYEAHLAALDATKAELLLPFSDEELERLSLAIAKRAEVAAAWSDQSVVIPATPNDVVDTCRRLKSELKRLARAKDASPLATLTVDEPAQTAIDDFAATLRMLEDYNKSVTTANEALSAIQLSASSADLAALKDVLARLNARERRVKLSLDCARYSKAKELKKLLESEKTAKRARLTQVSTELLDEYCDAINKRLRAFGADFEIVGLERSDAGGTPRATYALRLRDTDIPLMAESSSPSFSTTLSQGDRRLLALAFFLASLDMTPDLSDHSIIVDDPVSSFDVYRKAKMVDAAMGFVAREAQVVVLSHDPDFIRTLRDRGCDQVLQLRRAGLYCVVEDCDIDAVCESEYIEHYRELGDYLVRGRREEELRAVAKRVRPYLETNLRHRFPIELGTAKNLGVMIGDIKNCSADSALHCLDGELGEIERVNDYASPYHHNEGPKPLDRELREIVELTLRLGRN